MDHNNLYDREYKALLKKAGLAQQEFTFHSLRHHAVRASGSKVTALPAARAGAVATNKGSIRAVPVNHSAGPLPEG